jgi:hypothetical protein
MPPIGPRTGEPCDGPAGPDTALASAAADDPETVFRAHFGALVREAADALLSQTLPAFRPDPAEGISAFDSVGVVGFVGPSVRGTFHVAMWGDGIRAARAELYEDWIGELANQLAGRVKNQLCRQSITYDISPPTTVSGRGLSVAPPFAGTSLRYRCAVGECCVWVVLDVLGSVELRAVAEGEEPVTEGELLIFDS